MNKNTDQAATDDVMLDDYSEMMSRQSPRPNRFAATALTAPRFSILPDGFRQEIRTVHLDEDVARFFPDSDSINSVLRAIMYAIPHASLNTDAHLHS
jgi:hypothetical protein